MVNFSEPFIKHLILAKNYKSKYPEIRDLARKYEKASEPDDDKHYIYVLEDLIEKFSTTEYAAMKDFLREVTNATGIHVGFINEKELRSQSVISVMNRMFSDLKVGFIIILGGAEEVERM